MAGRGGQERDDLGDVGRGTEALQRGLGGQAGNGLLVLAVQEQIGGRGAGITGPPGSRGAEQLELLSVIGTQDLSVPEGRAPEGLSAAESGRQR
ncbi:helix-turn-helix domain protein [Streptomyces hygroscopicus subsp. jinggangensis 5008]|nr:helix-turn-helix domain protein [Streptomyces hygroscopicus subsp. jinggangensis 5008]AGF64111.1 helix-turn-helix domain protein [Streptomyces hygroscopicus subsp. jinggangensis TL01]